MFRVHCHPVVALTPLHPVRADYSIRGGVNFRDLVHAPEIDVHFSGDRVVLQHSGFAVDFQSLDDLVSVTALPLVSEA